jgi:Na+-driven multidrug efflux pump
MFSIIFDIFHEWKVSNTIAFPGYVIHFLDRSFWLSTFLLLGHHGKGNLATGLLATSTMNLAIYFMEGFLSSQDVFIFQSRNIEKIEKVWLYTSIIYVIVLTILTVGLIIAFDLYLYGILTLKTNVTFKTTLYLWFLLPALFFHGLQRLLQQYFTIKSIYAPVVVSLFLGLIFNAVGKNSLVFIHNLISI